MPALSLAGLAVGVDEATDGGKRLIGVLPAGSEASPQPLCNRRWQGRPA